MTVARIFDRLPSDAGVTFEGFGEVRIASRQDVRKKLESFLESCLTATSPSMRVLLGEWGEGKTDAFRRYVVPWSIAHNQKAIFVSASTLANSYDNPGVSRLIIETSLSSIRFLTATLNAASSTDKALPIPSPTLYDDPLRYVTESLEALTQNNARLIFFIDEFEELLINEKLNEIISGIKSILNPPQPTGVDSEIPEVLVHRSGKYEGRVHFVLACTPDAFHRLQASGDTSLIFGGLGRRAAQIDLPQISKSEALSFVHGLLRYSFNDGKGVAAVENAGILAAIARVGQSNPGVMVSLFSRFLSHLRISQTEMQVADYGNLLGFLKAEHVFVYGGESKCIENQHLERLVKIIGESNLAAQNLLKMLVGELRPVSLEEIARRLRITDKQVKSALATINETLKREEKLQTAILRMKPAKRNVDYAELRRSVSKWISAGEAGDFLEIGACKKTLEEVRDELTWYEFSQEGELIERLFVPSDPDSASAILDGISAEDAAKIVGSMDKKGCDEPAWALASPSLLQSLYPTPVPSGLEYIGNREMRSRLWKQVHVGFREWYDEHIIESFVALVESTGRIGVSKTRSSKSTLVGDMILSDRVMIRSLICSVGGDLEVKHIEHICGIVRGESYPIHLIVLLYSGEMSSVVSSHTKFLDLSERGQDILLPINVHPTTAKRMIVATTLLPTLKVEKDIQLYNQALAQLVDRDLEFTKSLETWMNRQTSKGKVIQDFETQYGPRELAESLKFYLNYMGSDLTMEEALEKNRKELLDITFYGAKNLGLAPDISGIEKFRTLTNELVDSGFLVYDRKSGRLHVVQTSIDNKIISLLCSGKRLRDDEIERHFIIEAKGKKLLANVYLNLLEYRGIVESKGNVYSLIGLTDLRERADQILEDLKRQLSAPDMKPYAHVFVTKEREYRLITPENALVFLSRLRESTDGLKSPDGEWIARQRLALVIRLSNHTVEQILQRIRGASKKGLETVRRISGSAEDFEGSITPLCAKAKRWMALDIDCQEINELKEVQRLGAEAREIHEAQFQKDDLTKLAKELLSCRDEFHFDRKDEDASWFNLKVRKLELLDNRIDEEISRSRDPIMQAEERFNNLDEREKRIRDELSKFGVDDRSPLAFSTSVFHRLKNIDIHEGTRFEKGRNLRITDIKRYAERVSEQNVARLEILYKASLNLGDAVETESSFNGVLESTKGLVSWAISVFDIDPQKKSAFDLEKGLKEKDGERSSLVSGVESVGLNDLPSLIRGSTTRIHDLEVSLREISSRTGKMWEEYLADLEEFIFGINELVGIARRRFTISSGDALNRELGELGKVLQKKPLESKSPVSRNVQTIERARRLFYSLVSPALPKEEADVMTVILNDLRRAKETWIPLPELYAELRQKLGLSESDATRIFRELTKKKLLRGAISLYA